MTEEEMRDLFGNADPFSDFFHTFFGDAVHQDDAGRRGRGRARTARQGRDVEQEITLGLEDAYRGTTRRLSIKHDGHARTVDVRIPAGVGDLSRVRIAAEGETGAGGAPSAYTEAGPPDRMIAFGCRASISAAGMVDGTISE